MYLPILPPAWSGLVFDYDGVAECKLNNVTYSNNGNFLHKVFVTGRLAVCILLCHIAF